MNPAGQGKTCKLEQERSVIKYEVRVESIRRKMEDQLAVECCRCIDTICLGT